MLVNTHYFSDAANDYKLNKGIYTKAPIGSREFREYWREQKERCNNGYTVGDTSITGRNYYYLNFTPMMRVDESKKRLLKGTNKQVDKILDFPKFLEVQYNWWWAKHIAQYGLSIEEYNKLNLSCIKIAPDNLIGGKHISCAKTRGCGFSYMEAADGTYNYNFIPGSKSFYFAAIEGYLLGDGILSKCWDNLNFLNDRTSNYWRKNRHAKNTESHKRASYKDAEGNEKGYKSEIIGVIVDDPNKVRGKRGIKLSFEEGGSFRRLKDAIDISRPLVEQGSYVTGQISVFGTGGEEGANIEGLEEVFYKPWLHNMLEFENIYDNDEISGTTCGFFVPCTVATDGFIDEDGIADTKGAREFWNRERLIKKKDTDPRALDRLVAERPFTPSECFQRVNTSLFNIFEIRKQISFIKSSRDIQGLIQHGVLTYGEKGVEFSPSDVKPLLIYPHGQNDNLNGAVTIYHRPYTNPDSSVPDNLYIIVVDPFYKDDAADRTSLGCVYVLERNNNTTGYIGERIVASYIARPVLDTFYNNLFKLSDYYNAKIQSENGGGGEGIIHYAKAKKMLHKLEYEPEMLHNRELASNQKNRAFFMNMTADRKKQGIIYFADWLMQPIAIKEGGEVVYNLNRIYDLGLLEEIRKFNDKDNFDRISTMILAMFMLKEKQAIEVASARRYNSIFDRTFFNDGYGSGFDDIASLGISFEE